MGTDAVRLHVQNNENIFYSLMLMQMYKKMINGLFYFSSPLMTNDADASYIARPLFTLIMFCTPFVHNKYHGFSLFLGKFEQNHAHLLWVGESMYQFRTEFMSERNKHGYDYIYILWCPPLVKNHDEACTGFNSDAAIKQMHTF
jgi:hypothetical protein